MKEKAEYKATRSDSSKAQLRQKLFLARREAKVEKLRTVKESGG